MNLQKLVGSINIRLDGHAPLALAMTVCGTLRRLLSFLALAMRLSGKLFALSPSWRALAVQGRGHPEIFVGKSKACAEMTKRVATF